MASKKRKIVIIGLFVLIIASCIGYAQFYLRRASALHVFAEVISCVTTSKQIVALTFDDGPNPEATLQILDILKEHNAYATFFVTGENAERYPEIVRRLIEEGHELGNHSWNHIRLTYKSPEFTHHQIEKVDGFLRKLGYEGTIHFRAPFGHGLFVLPYTLMKMDRPHILWSIELNDWNNPSPEYMMEDLNGQIKPGAIILLHDGYSSEHQSRQATVELVEMILQTYMEQGYDFVTMSALLEAHENPLSGH